MCTINILYICFFFCTVMKLILCLLNSKCNSPKQTCKCNNFRALIITKKYTIKVFKFLSYEIRNSYLIAILLKYLELKLFSFYYTNIVIPRSLYMICFFYLMLAKAFPVKCSTSFIQEQFNISKNT